MQLFKKNDVLNSQQVVWQIRGFWLDATQCEPLNSWFYGGWTLKTVVDKVLWRQDIETIQRVKAEFELASLQISGKIIRTILVGWIQTVCWSTEAYYFAELLANNGDTIESVRHYKNGFCTYFIRVIPNSNEFR